MCLSNFVWLVLATYYCIIVHFLLSSCEKDLVFLASVFHNVKRFEFCYPALDFDVHCYLSEWGLLHFLVHYDMQR
jgi:hypothetical protein